MYQPAIDLATVTAIDMHVHIEVDDHGHTSLPEPLVAAASRYFRTDGPRPAVDAVARYYRERGMAAVVFTVDAGTQLKHPPLSSVDVARAAAEHADVLIPFGSVDPRTGDAALELADRLITEEGVRGFKFHPTVQGFDPGRDEYAPLWGLIERAGLPAIFHTGQTGIGAGTPGGHGLRLGLSNPMLLDPVAADFPDLQIVMAHPSVPWQDEALSVATHKPNTWIDLSGWSPKYFPAELVRHANSVLRHRVLFGTDYPLLTPDRWLRDVTTTDLRPDVLPGILKDNAVRLLGLAGERREEAP
ncbi:amidohydrolase family protein [Micromonospora sp. WMMD987]|jgi:predicted TIM-barrel fold metal-dependent hydrolase|uniref:amidohydrolase family protein n=1 Tax=Micromonospora TaxID=1873 RepID=UPI00249AD3DC|nr:amidohydrolase family protein [Micromonospora sp. WMMD987]WFE93402.1 amidohydrolase family protein [Micromonospora sp. WMMD987]